MDCFGNKWLFNLFLLSAGLYLTRANYLFASEGEAMQLNCNYNQVNSWQSVTKEFVVLCESGKPMININLRISNRINISSDCTILTITNFTKEDVGTYVCFINHKEKDESDVFETHKIHVQLRRITITEANGDLVITRNKGEHVITRNEGDLINLTCTVKGRKQDEKLFWISENSVESSVGTNGSISKTFVAQRSDNMKEFTCVANNSVNNLPLKTSVRLNLILKPRIKITSSPSTVITIGQRITLTCRDENKKKEKFDVFLWTHNNVPLPNKTKQLSFENAGRSIAGQYACFVKNAAGRESAFINITVNYLGKPEKPKGVVINSSSKYIFLQWQSGLNDGSCQSFIIQYRKRSSSAWKFLTTENSKKTNHSIYILNLEPSTKYEIRMYALNEHGNSTYTKHIISTTNEKSNEKQSNWTEFLLVMVVIVPVCIIIIWWRFKKAKNRSHDNSHRANEDYIQEEGGAIQNHLYQAANDLIQLPSVSSNREDDAYSSIHRRQQVVHEQNVTYQISKRDKKDNQYKQQSSMNNGWDPQNLNYVEVAFDNTIPNGAFCINGADERTPYADIDFFARADPLMISEENEESLSSHSVENDDFVSVEEVQQWKISKE